MKEYKDPHQPVLALVILESLLCISALNRSVFSHRFTVHCQGSVNIKRYRLHVKGWLWSFCQVVTSCSSCGDVLRRKEHLKLFGFKDLISLCIT